ncbi:MAG: IgGFc-binding protein [Deltaproteobacteria bacterium]|nr:IgGFc-binding protein [Deltaproteobacteria bacterium]
MRRTSYAIALTTACISTAIVASCTSRDGFDEATPTLAVEAGADAPCTERRCSPDLHEVRSACGDDRVIRTCSPNEGCGAGECVDACESARLSKGSIGCSFWTLPPDDPREATGSCFVAMMANTWNKPVALRAELGSEALDISGATYLAKRAGDTVTYEPLVGPVPVGEVALVFLAQDKSASAGGSMTYTPCPAGVKVAFDRDPITHGTARTRAFHLTSDAPISAYSIFPYGGAKSYVPSATLLLPVSSWEKSYVAIATSAIPYDGTPGSEDRFLQIVASEDATKVEMRPTVAIAGGKDVVGTQAGQAQSWTLSRGQVLQITQRADPTGSPILADKPVGVFGGASCSFLPATIGYCDITQQQIPPFGQWGSEIALVPFRPRISSLTDDGADLREVVPYSLVGAVDGTVLSYDPERPLGAPETLRAGEVVVFSTTSLLVVRSQDSRHPFHANVYMTGSQFNGGTGKPANILGGGGGPRVVGDPDFVNLVPTSQFLDRYVFFTDHTYPETTLTFVRKRTPSGFRPVTLECAGEVAGFAPLGTTGEYEYAWVRITTGYTPQTFAGGTCGYGRHEARSEGPFSVTIWGAGQDASYGYAGGAGSRPANDALPPPVR